MQFFYGGFTHADNEVAYDSIQKAFIRGATQRAHLLHVVWNLRGKLLGTQSSIFSQYNTLLLAYQQDGFSAGFNGTPFTINGQQAIGGCRVVSPISHGDLGGAEMVTYLKYTFALEADFMWASPTDPLSFQETTTFTDNYGFPMYIELLPVSGLPILQQVTDSSWYFGTQSGSLTQAGPGPVPMPPLFPGNLRTSAGAARTLSWGSPKMIRGNPIEYSVNWRYEYISSLPFQAYPNQVG
jgi:hypothetical protein